MGASSKQIDFQSPEAFFNRELSWLNFAQRVLAQVEDESLPLLERVKFAGIMGMLHDEFFTKRIGGLKRQINKGVEKFSIDGRTPLEELAACREVVLEQSIILNNLLKDSLLPALEAEGIPILLDYQSLGSGQREYLSDYFFKSVLPILTPLAVDDEHPFPFISNLGLNLAVQLKDSKKASKRFVRIKVPDNRPRWIELPDRAGWVPMELVIANNLELLFPGAKFTNTYFFRVTRGIEADVREVRELHDQDMPDSPGSLLRYVSGSLKARRFAGVVRLQVGSEMPHKPRKWLADQLKLSLDDVYLVPQLIGVNDLLKFRPNWRDDLCDPPHRPVTHPKLRSLTKGDPAAIFEQIRKGDILLHHPYHNFETSVQHFLSSAAVDPQVLGIKLTIYRTSSKSPIIQALVDAARRGKQAAVILEITARFDEAPNIAWCELLEREGVHVAYGVEKLKTHVKLALVIREEQGQLVRYVHIGTGNYHSGTARIYEDLGMLTCDPELGEDAAAVFNELTGSYSSYEYSKLLVAPNNMQDRFIAMINREQENAEAKKPAGIYAKLNQLQDPDIIQALYLAGQAGVPITLNVRGLCCLRPGVIGLSENIRVYSVIGRFLEHSRIYRFENEGNPEHYLGSADWMRRNLKRRMETVTPVSDPHLQAQLDEIISVYETDNASVWELSPTGEYHKRKPAKGEGHRSSQPQFIVKGG